MKFTWFPWRHLISRLARSRGFLDPVALLARLRRFAQPSEVTEPLELLRAGVVFHARGLINARAIQHNLDWVWPFWIHRQFDPRDPAFVPRSFSITHVNLTHRNWTAVGIPDYDQLPIVDPRGLVTPHYDGWSIDTWIVPDEGEPLLPSRARRASQRLLLDRGPIVETTAHDDASRIVSRATVMPADGGGECRIDVRAESATAGWLVVSVRPANPEGISFVDRVEAHESGAGLRVNEEHDLFLEPPPSGLYLSDYGAGDVFHRLDDPEARRDAVECGVGLASAAGLYRLEAGSDTTARVVVPLGAPSHRWRARLPAALGGSRGGAQPTVDGGGPSTLDGAGRATGDDAAPPAGDDAGQATGDNRPSIGDDAGRAIGDGPAATRPRVGGAADRWSRALAGCCALQVPDEWTAFLFDAAARALVLHAPGDVYPGPYTYKRFWFRDAAFVLDALLALGLTERVGAALGRFPERQRSDGYFHSQEGEWDSNGEAIWIIDRWRRTTGAALPDPIFEALVRGARWITGKRLPDELNEPHAGLMPAGFSAEHLGPNDYYYWDDFWSAAGLRAAAATARARGDQRLADGWDRDADKILAAVDRSLARTADRRRHDGVPASPYRRLDAGAVGSLACSYPLRLWKPRDPRLLATAEFLLDRCLLHGGFYHEVIHSGINTYLTLHLAQVLLRAGDTRCLDLMRTVATLATSTGQWPEAIHPQTGGGCMGDGQHAWAAAEWVLMVRNAFVREEDGRLVLASGVGERWLAPGRPLRLGPTPTPWGDLSVEIVPEGDTATVAWEAKWRRTAPLIEVRLPGFAAATSVEARQREGAERAFLRVERVTSTYDAVGVSVPDGER